MPEPIITKKCWDCKETKPLSEFHKKCDTADAHCGKCKICISAYHRSEQYKIIQQRYLQTEKGKASQKRGQKKWQQTEKGKAGNARARIRYRQTEKGRLLTRIRGRKLYRKYPARSAARYAITNAIKIGKIPPAKTLKCFYCPKQAHQYHHWSYLPEHWFDVISVCIPCHTKLRNERIT